MWKLWLVFSGIFFIIEMCTVGFLVFWFAIGALITMIASFFIDNVIIQATIFLVSSTVLLFATRRFTEKFAKTENSIKTNAFSIEGEIGKVIQDIDPIEGKGQIRIHGEVWSAQSTDGTCISQGTEVIVEKLSGVKAIVKPV